MSTFEIRIYIWVFLFFCLVVAFGVLRLYNAIVGNSRFLNVVRQGYQKNVADLKRLSDTLKVSIDQNSNRLSNTHKIVQVLQNLTEAIKNLFTQDGN